MSSRLTFYVAVSLIALAATSLAVANDGPFSAPMPKGTAPSPAPQSAPTAGGVYTSPYELATSPSRLDDAALVLDEDELSQPYSAEVPNYPPASMRKPYEANPTGPIATNVTPRSAPVPNSYPPVPIPGSGPWRIPSYVLKTKGKQ